jgi:hypothetical protein
MTPRGARHRRSIAALVAILASLSVSRVARAHPIHTTLTVVTFDQAGTQLMLRAFADDFSASVARYVGKPAPKDSVVTDADVMRYVAAHVVVSNAAGIAVRLQSCGVRREGGLYWVCVRAPSAATGKGTAVLNTTLHELHADQVNIVRVERANARRTLVFTKGSKPTAMS